MANGELYVNSIPANIGKRFIMPHQAYSNLENSVKEYLNHMDKNSRLEVNGDDDSADMKIRIVEISTTNSNDKISPRKSTSEAAFKLCVRLCKKSICNRNYVANVATVGHAE